ncbi:MAG: dienelactone hydrolase [Candidatus Omnitrophica bacterium CG11_big_fil_rev_8_21_14_0_20_63_9]|nr:MAG: dienelactone hydrolase [Candidatus Omnitrophica bacterium CG11_big_fil_rev_8_21_14_0_20_63_9]
MNARRRWGWIVAAGLVLGWTPSVQAHLHTETVEYAHGEILLEGYLAYDGHLTERRPVVLVVHEWKGLGPYAMRRADQLARLGYVAFAVDMYGKGVRAEDHEQAAALSGTYRKDRQLMRARIQTALEWIKAHEKVDPTRIAAIGYCFGGTTVLELARSGADVLGVVSFHGGLDTPNPKDARQIKGRVLVLHGAGDSFVSQEQVQGFIKEMQEAGVRYELVQYPGAVHSFTVQEAGNDPSQGMAYNENADRQSWEAMTAFLAELFGETGSRHASDGADVSIP